jgi:hypothetical protein
VLQGTAKVRLDHLESRQSDDGCEDESTVNALREYLLVLRLRGSAAVDEIDRVTCRALERVCQPKDGLSTSQCRLLLGTASSYITCRRVAEAQEILDRVGAHLPTSAVQTPQAQCVLPTYLFLMGFLRYVTGRLDEAKNYFLQTYYALEKARGPHSSAVADILLAFIDFPGLLQDPADIKHWRHKYEQVQAEMLAGMEKKGARQTLSEPSELWLCDEPLDIDVNTAQW